MNIPRPALRQQNLILTIFGMYCRPPRASLDVADLLSLMGDLGYEPQGVRSAISRLKGKGILTTTRRGRQAAYSLDASMAEVISEGDERIFAQRRPESNGQWALLSFSVPETQRALRHQIRAALTQLGFGTLNQGLWIAPASNLAEARKALRRRNLDQYVEYFVGHYVDDAQLQDKVGQWWDLRRLNAYFDDFLDLYSSTPADWQARLAEDPPAQTRAAGAHAQGQNTLARDAFSTYVPMLTMWRKLPYLVPPLPAEVVPEQWDGPQARAIFHQTHRLLSALAQDHADGVLGR